MRKPAGFSAYARGRQPFGQDHHPGDVKCAFLTVHDSSHARHLARTPSSNRRSMPWSGRWTISMPRSSVLTPARIGARSVRIQQIHQPHRRAARIDRRRRLRLGACPPQIVAHFIGNIDQAADHGESSVRSVHDPSHEMGMFEDCHEAAGGQPRCRAQLNRIAGGFTATSRGALTKSVRRGQIRRSQSATSASPVFRSSQPGAWRRLAPASRLEVRQ